MNHHVARSLLCHQRHVMLSRSIRASLRVTSATRRITASSRVMSASARKPPKDFPPPLPPSSKTSSAMAAAKTQQPKQQKLSPVEAKQRYLESKKRTEEFLQDPQKKIHQLHSEIDQVREKLEREVYNKTMWQRLIDRLKRKQHSLINMIAASFAYLLAYQLHLKRLANQKLRDELEEQEQKQEKLKQLLRSLLEEEYIQDMAVAAVDEISNGTDRKSSWSWSAPRQSLSDSSTPSQSQIDAIANLLRQKLEEQIGDAGLDEATKNERDIERIWQQNQQKLEMDDDDDIAGLLALAAEATEDEGSEMKPSKQKRVIDM